VVEKIRMGYVRTAIVALAAAITVAGCVVEPVGPRPGVYVGPAYAPPAPAAEVIGVAPAPGYIWSGGYWGWAGGRYVWTGGHWMAPRPGFYWVNPHWVRGARGWRFVGGHWRR
jgi:hypothetical protein